MVDSAEIIVQRGGQGLAWKAAVIRTRWSSSYRSLVSAVNTVGLRIASLDLGLSRPSPSSLWVMPMRAYEVDRDV